MVDRWFRLGDHGRYPAQDVLNLRFSISSMLLAVVVTSAGLALSLGSKQWYESNHSGHALCAVVDTIENGDSLQSVRQKFHGAIAVGHDDPFVQNVWQQRSWPIEPNDEFFHFLFNGEFGVYMQFRDNRVVNHTDRFFENDIIRQMKNNTKPPVIFAYGVRPIQYGIYSLAGLGIVLCFWFGKIHRTNQTDQNPAPNAG